MPKVGDVIAGKYRLEHVAGEGGMGIVYAAEHLVLRQRVAVKVLNPEAAGTESTVERFTREAQAAARIQSEHVARVFDAGSLDSGAPFLVMEFLEGCDLGELISLQKTLPEEEVADLMLQTLEALAHAHLAGIVHRDLKPANLFLACRPDGGNTIKIVDFGISKAVKATHEDKTLTGHHILGSPAYMSPEQLRNSKDLDGRADIWSLGVVAYEMLTGKLPFDGDGVGEIFAAILEQDAKPVHELDPNISKAFSDLVAKCLKRDVKDRWLDAATLARAVLPFGSGDRSKIVASVESLVMRSRNHLEYETPSEARLVVDLIAAAAERAKSRSIAPPSNDPPPVARSSRRAKEDEKKTSAKRWIFTLVALAVLIGGMSVFAAARATRAANGARPVLAAPPATTPAPSATSPAPSASVENDPAAVELPDNAQPTQRPRNKPPKPTRPKFLNSRE